MTRKDLFYKLIEENKNYLKEIGVISIGLFGSSVRGDYSNKSDFDILVKFDKAKKSFKAFTALCDFIENNLGENYEIVTFESLSPHIAPYILEEVRNVEITS